VDSSTHARVTFTEPELSALIAALADAYVDVDGPLDTAAYKLRRAHRKLATAPPASVSGDLPAPATPDPAPTEAWARTPPRRRRRPGRWSEA
jgi:hypothetical protein